MADKQGISQIFDSRLRDLRRKRARRRMAEHGLSFLIERCIEDVIERILDVNRCFETLLMVGPFDVSADIIAALPENRRPKRILFNDHVQKSDAQADLIISLLDLQSENDLPDYLSYMSKRLNPDGVMLVAMFGGETLTELRQALYMTDQDKHAGLSARIYPMITHSQAAMLLSRAGLNLPVIDMDRFTVSYSALRTLLADLRDLGETNTLLARTSKFTGKAYLSALEENYNQLFEAGGKLPASFEIVWMTGWKPHKSQQKPLTPGSAKMRLADALKTQETKL